MCVEGFDTKRELDKHITDKHIFICSECLKTFKTKEERDTHMKMDHKDVSTEMTKQQLKSTARESPEKKRTDEPQKPGRRCGHSTQPRRNGGRLKKEKRKENFQLHRPKKRQNVPREMTEMRTKITSLLKNQVARTHHMSQPKRSSREPTRKVTSKTVFCKKCIFPLQVKTNKVFLFSCRFLIRSLTALTDYFTAP